MRSGRAGAGGRDVLSAEGGGRRIGRRPTMSDIAWRPGPSPTTFGDARVLRLREQLVRKARSAQQQINAFLLQHGLAEPKGLTCWTDAALRDLRQLGLAAELRFCLDVFLDELDQSRSRP